MEIKLKQENIEEAIRTYLSNCGIAGIVKEISFQSGRGIRGVSAEVTMESVLASGTKAEVEKQADVPSVPYSKQLETPTPNAEQPDLEANETEAGEPVAGSLFKNKG